MLAYPHWIDPQKRISESGTTWRASDIAGVQEGLNPAHMQGGENAEQWSREAVSLILCFYDPQELVMATRFHDGLLISQSNDEPSRSSLTFLQYGRILDLPELTNNQRVRQYNISVDLRRRIVRQYGIQSLVDASVQSFRD